MTRRWILALIVLLWPGVAAAQQAQLAGAVRDSQKAAIADASLRLVEETTGIVLSTQSNERGSYLFGSVRPGTYRLEVAADGFSTVTHRDVVLHVDQRAVLDVTLAVGPVADEITVTGTAPLLGKADGSLGTVINRELVEQLPTRGRSISGLVALVPGVVLTGSSSADGSEFRVNGQRTLSNSLTVDGAAAPAELGASNLQTSGGQRFATTATGTIGGGISMDAVQEIHIQTSSFAAEFGRTPGAQISLITRSGTNTLHGSAFEQFRDDRLTANDWFANSRGVAKPASEEHQFGATTGGPILRDRLFFFASYEGLRLNRPMFTNTNIPSMEVREQNIPIRAALNAYPAPTGPGRADGTAPYAAFTDLGYRSDAMGIRVDWSAGNTQVFGRYSRLPSATHNGSPFASDVDTNQGSQNLTVGLTRTLGGRTLVELRGNYNDAEYATVSEGPIRDFFPESAPETGWLSVGFSGLSTQYTGNRIDNIQRQSNFVGSLSHVRGMHQLKVGFDYRVVWPSIESGYTGELRYPSLAQGLMGQSGTFTARYVPPTHMTYTNTSFYAQDTWQVRPRFSLNYGVRWDINPPPSYADDEGPLAVVTFDPPAALTMSASRNVPLWETDYKGFFPRVGASYALDDNSRTVLSGGAGLFGDLNANAAGVASSFTVGAQTLKTVSNVQLPLTADHLAVSTTPSILPPFSGAVFVVDPQLQTPRTTHWNVTVQRVLAASHEVSASYVGARGHHLLQNRRYNPGLSPDFTGNVYFVSNGGRSRYESLQLRYRGRHRWGLQGLASYTLSEAEETENRLNGSLRSKELTPSSNDVRHVFNAAVTWMIPRLGSGPLAQVWNGWGVHFVVSVRSAFPFSVRATDFTNIAGQEFLSERYASLVPGVPIVLEDGTAPGGRRYNRAAFVEPPAGQQGDTTRNAYRGFGAQQLDLGLDRSLPLLRDARLHIRIDAFNLFNTPTFGLIVSEIANPSFGVPTSMAATGLSSLYRPGGPRSIALSIRVEY